MVGRCWEVRSSLNVRQWRKQSWMASAEYGLVEKFGFGFGLGSGGRSWFGFGDGFGFGCGLGFGFDIGLG